MSPLSSEQLRIMLCPRQASLTRFAGGWNPRVTAKRFVSCDPPEPGDAPWRSVLAAIGPVIPEFNGRKGDAVVILSNHFVRYAMVPHSDQIATPDEEQALVRHTFAQIYGDAADRWAFRLSDARAPGGSRLACAMDLDLQESLRALFRPTKLMLRSLQPYLMVAFNQWRHHLRGSAWFAVVEQGRLCLAKLDNSRWHSIRSVTTGDDWFGELTIQLKREEFLASSNGAASANRSPVFLYAPGCSESIPPKAEDHTIHLLRSLPSRTGKLPARRMAWL